MDGGVHRIYVHLNLPENNEKPTAVYAKKAHKRGFEEVNRVKSGGYSFSVHPDLPENNEKPTVVCAKRHTSERGDAFSGPPL